MTQHNNDVPNFQISVFIRSANSWWTFYFCPGPIAVIRPIALIDPWVTILNECNRDVTTTDVVSCAAVDELNYKPRNTKEKWLLRIAYWGTIVLVAFLWWEYVKAR
jgi:hypothetical protein